MQITLVTGNRNKLREFRSIFKEKVVNEMIDLDEIQSMDLKEICEHKVKQAFEILKRPVLVEDSGFFIDELKGLPGPFIKFFEERLGNGAVIKLLGNLENRGAKHVCCIAYYDGEKLLMVEGEKRGVVTKEFMSGEGFGFDFCFIPEGYDRTYSELGLNEKNRISARKDAIENFREKFSKL